MEGKMLSSGRTVTGLYKFIKMGHIWGIFKIYVSAPNYYQDSK
jgi:hypothetical protein